MMHILPCDAAQRHRSCDTYPRISPIMHDVAQRFGHVMVPVQAQRFADGGVSITAPVQQQVSAAVDTGQIASAVSAAMSSWQPIVQLGDRELVGVMRRGERMGAR